MDRTDTPVSGASTNPWIRVSGRTLFTDDVLSADSLHAAFALSSEPHARIRSIDTSEALAMPGVFAAITGADTGNRRFGRRVRDYPVLAIDRVLFVGQRVAAVAAWDAETARQAADRIQIDYEPLDAVLDPQDALRSDAPVLHPDYDRYENAHSDRPHHNVQGHMEATEGRGTEAFADADEIYEHSFGWTRSHSAPLEPHACLVVGGETEIHVYSSHKEPYRLRRDIALLAGRPEEDVIVHPVLIGGDFGAKGVPYIEGACYLLSVRTGRPVRTSMTYFEELTSTGARHPGSMRLRTGLRDGAPLAHESETVLNGGAFAALKPQPAMIIPVVGISSNPYQPPHRSESGIAVYTNNLPGAQVRSPGEFQATFAGESHFDMIARARGEDPLEFRLRCARRPQARKVLAALVEPVSAWRAQQEGTTGIGVAVFHRGSGAGDTTVACRATAAAVELTVSTPDQGAGSYTVFQNLAARTLGVEPDRVLVRAGGTDLALTDAGAGASRVTAVAGRACIEACKSLLDEVGGISSGSCDGYWIADRLRELGREAVSVSGRWQVARGKSPTPPTHGAMAIELDVDTETGVIRLHRCLLVVDAGMVVNEVGHRGQLEGGFVYGIGQTLYEDLIVEDGQVMAASLGDYKLASASDVPPLEIRLLSPPADEDEVEALRPVGELGNLGVAPAVANAIDDAVGVRITELPITAERVWSKLRGRT